MGSLNEREYELAPPNLNLEQVHVYVRHGERTPVGIRMNEAPGNIPAFWNLCKTARRFQASVLGDNGESKSVEVLRMSERGDGHSEEGECLLGELTDLGRTVSLFLYVFFCQLLRLKHKVNPSRGPNIAEIIRRQGSFLNFLNLTKQHTSGRSTNMPRTIETLQQVLYGLYPTSKIKEGFAPRVRTRHPKDENLIGNMAGCDRLAELAIGFSRAAAMDNNPKLEKFNSKLSKYINGNPIRIDGQPRLSGIMDTIRAADAHGIRVPPEFHDSSIVNDLETAICDEWFRGYKNHEFRRLAMGRLLSEMSDQMTGIVNGTNNTKIRVNACHDTTLAGLRTTLDVFDNRWPDFTASIIFELFSEQTQPAQSMFSMGVFARTPPAKRFVRMRYQNQNLALPACAAPGAHLPGSPEFCTLAAFQEHVRTLTPTDWNAECTALKRAEKS
ncbi:hypothetical protein FRC09_004381 [Ceratobasidium sp. 395]|nr:hypothetical protein FRC09_004381 [Ceratobasidium sp. 395]